MDKSKEKLKGSDSRDIFKQLHREKLGNGFYASDLDLCLIAKYPPGIVAFLDYKRLNDYVSFSEGTLYNVLLKIAPVYVIKAELIDNTIYGPFEIDRIHHVDWKPEPPNVYYYSDLPVPIKEDVIICENWTELKKWESEIRIDYKKEQ